MLKQCYNFFSKPVCKFIYGGLIASVIILLQAWNIRSIFCKNSNSGLCSAEPKYLILSYFLSSVFFTLITALMLCCVYATIIGFYKCFYKDEENETRYVDFV